MYSNDNESKERIYDLMIGVFNLEKYPVKESKFVKNEFADGEICAELYSEISKAKDALCNKLGVDEDKDLECIINNFYDIMKYLSMQMYDYGVLKCGEKIQKTCIC